MKTKFFYGMTALATLGLAACTADELAPSAPGQVAEADMTRYISVNISAPSVGGTRAAEYAQDPTFNEGEGFESVVKDAFFVFYDKDNKVVGDIVNVTDLKFTDFNSAGSDHSSAHKVVGVNILKGQNLPAKVMVYINPQTQEGILNPLNVVETITRSDVKKTGGDTEGPKNPKGWLFSMSNSVYFDENPEDAADPKKGKLCNIVEIPTDGLFKTEKEAEKELDKAQGKDFTDDEGTTRKPTEDEIKASLQKVTTVHVERYAAKVMFKWLANADNNGNENPVYGGDGTDGKPVLNTYTYETKDGITTVTEQIVKLTFVPDKWDVNAESNEMFVIKTFRSQNALGDYTMDNLTYAGAMGTDAANPLLGNNSSATNWLWNSQANCRSYWGCSPSYYSTTYPEVASDYFENGAYNPEMKLKYLTWKELQTNGQNVSTTLTTDYVKETTVGNLGLHEATNKYASIPSVIVTGNYNLSCYGDAGNVVSTLPDKTTFYLYGTGADNGKGIYFEAAKNGAEQTLASAAKDDKNNVVGSSLLYRLAKRQNIVRMKETVTKTDNGVEKSETKVRDLTEEEMAKIFTIARPSNDVLEIGAITNEDGTKQTVKLAARKFTLQLSSSLTFTTKEDGGVKTEYDLIYNDSYGDKDVVPAENAIATQNIVNNLLLRNVGYADKYTNGMAYYNIPIKHYGWYRKTNDNRVLDDADGKEVKGDIDWSKTRVGDFGVVRNHLYNIQVSAINGLATAISDETTPIIPPQETEEYFVAYRIYILNWAVVPTQNEEL